METITRESAYGGESSSRLIVATGPLSEGYHFFLRRMSDRHIQCRITGPDDGRVQVMADNCALALGLATGAHCRWVSWREEMQQKVSIVLGEPLFEPGVRFPMMRRDVDQKDFMKFVRLVSETLSAQASLRDSLSLPELAWPPKGTYLDIIALLSAAVTEALLRSFCTALPGTSSVKPFDEGQLTSFKALLNQQPIVGHVLTPRVTRMLDSLRNVRPTDVLHAVQAAKPRLFLDDEIEAWKTLRNPAAHGNFDNTDPDFLRKVGLIFNVINKIVMCAVGYEGQFVDYSTMEWAVNRFGDA